MHNSHLNSGEKDQVRDEACSNSNLTVRCFVALFPQHGTAWSDLSLMYHKPPKCSCCAVMNDFSNFPSVFSSSFFKGSFGLATFILL